MQSPRPPYPAHKPCAWFVYNGGAGAYNPPLIVGIKKTTGQINYTPIICCLYEKNVLYLLCIFSKITKMEIC